MLMGPAVYMFQLLITLFVPVAGTFAECVNKGVFAFIYMCIEGGERNRVYVPTQVYSCGTQSLSLLEYYTGTMDTFGTL